jgi:thiamine pyrophosphate-dependent acetolactate synthase large subunit-like protein
MVDDDSPETADQFECTRRILEITPDAVLVSNLGVASYVLADVADRDRNFYQWGSMGVTTPVGLGLALSVDDNVTVLEGDGSLLMALGELSTIGRYDPENFTVVVWDNAAYATTGGQETHSQLTDFAAIADACSVRAYEASSDVEFSEAYRDAVEVDHASLVVCHVDSVDPDARPPFDYAAIKRRVHDALDSSTDTGDSG